MLLPVKGISLLGWAWLRARDFFEHVVIAVPAADQASLEAVVWGSRARFFGYDGDENNVLGRFHACAHMYREHPDDVIYRITPDDWPLDIARERFTLGQLDEWQETVTDPDTRQHIGLLMPQRIEINTQADYDAVLARG